MALRSAAALLLLLGALVGCGPTGGASPGRDGLHGARLDQPYPPPTARLADTDGASYSFATSPDSPITLVYFGYTHCPDVCPLTMANVASALVRLDDDQRSEVDVVFVTTDPARDDAATVRRWLDRYDPGFVGLTGDLDTIVKVARAYAVFIGDNTRLPSGGYEVEHGTSLVALDDAGRGIAVWTEGFSAADLSDDLAALLKDRT